MFKRKQHPLEAEIEAATSPTNVSENWQQIMVLVDKAARESDQSCEELVHILEKKLSDRNPRVILQALELVNALFQNENKKVLRAASSKSFTGIIQKLALSPSLPPAITNKLGQMLADWDTICRKDPAFALMCQMISSLRTKGVRVGAPTSFQSRPQPSERTEHLRQQEDEMLKKAIEASLQETGPSRSASSKPAVSKAPDCKPARALYDFEGVEDNELSLKAGNVLDVMDDSDANWWKGRLASGREGFFPASFVTYDLKASLPQETTVQQAEDDVVDEPPVEEATEPEPEELAHEEGQQVQAVPVTEGVIDEFYEVVKNAVPEDDTALDRIDALETACEQYSQQLNAKVDVLDNKLAEITDLNEKFAQLARVYERMMSAGSHPAPWFPQGPAPVPGPNSYGAAPMHAGPPAGYGSPHQPPPQSVGGMQPGYGSPQPPQHGYHDHHSHVGHPPSGQQGMGASGPPPQHPHAAHGMSPQQSYSSGPGGYYQPGPGNAPPPTQAGPMSGPGYGHQGPPPMGAPPAQPNYAAQQPPYGSSPHPHMPPTGQHPAYASGYSQSNA